jgi:acyl-CoA thioesterase FadM
MTAPLPAVGDRLPPYPTAVSAERQRRYHAGAGVTVDFGGRADVSILANDTIHATRHLNQAGGNGLQLVGLHLGQTLHQAQPIRLDEPLTAEGRVTAMAPAARGTRVTFAFEFRRPDGSVPLTSEINSLRVDSPTMRQLGAAAAEAFDAEGYAKALTVALTPQRVADYSFEFPDYRVHFDQAVADDIGLRVPIAQGLTSLTWMLAVLAQRGVPSELDIAAQFRRPIYWDETVDLLARGERELWVVGADGAPRSLGRVSHVAR